MQGKITLITPPDFYENTNTSILFMHLTEQEQDTVSQWLAKTNITQNINFYLYSDETNIGWLFYALSRCEYKYINMDCVNFITQALGGYILGKNNTYYTTHDPRLSEVFGYINSGRIDNITQFLESILSDQTNNNS